MALGGGEVTGKNELSEENTYGMFTKAFRFLFSFQE